MGLGEGPHDGRGLHEVCLVPFALSPRGLVRGLEWTHGNLTLVPLVSPFGSLDLSEESRATGFPSNWIYASSEADRS